MIPPYLPLAFGLVVELSTQKHAVRVEFVLLIAKVQRLFNSQMLCTCLAY